MSAHLARLEDNLIFAVQQGAISLVEAWAFQDLMLMAPEYSVVEMPDCLQPMLGRMYLLEVQPDNRLPA